MSIEDRLRGALAEAVATEPPPERSPFEQIARRRRRRPLIAASVALVLLLAAAVAFTGIRVLKEPVRPTSTIVPPDWKEFRDQKADLSFRYPPDWVVRRRRRGHLPPRRPGGTAAAQVRGVRPRPRRRLPAGPLTDRGPRLPRSPIP